MAIPKYDEMYRVFLECLADMQQHKSKELRDIIAARLSVSDTERQERLPSGQQAIFDNRVGWTRTYLKKAGLITSPQRGIYQLTQQGKQVLDSNPDVIDNSFLEQFESFRQFMHAEPKSTKHIATDSQDGQSPQDTFDLAYQKINHALADDLLTEIMKQSPVFFEKMVVQLLENMGYGGSVENAGLVVGQTGDEGIDGIIREDKLGFSLIYIQAKRWDRTTSIGRPELQKFVGALAGQGANKGLFITTAQFTKEAREYAKKQHTTKVVLVDGESLAKLMIEYNLGVSTEAVYQIKRLDSDFFSDDND
ncbi:restriction endonuclease [Intestinimonas butyriciproducens]|uniref:restriction endonuclease n=1 Tax=Intestinimonas butyriciproducens TaxID=1297617 RepID=UPI00195A46C5|nr:restriction endonuclease [Intestinimonas butyriciproducens]MBM6918975.1 restriction endonuclease [Intestinimonas butyriciproducens]